MSYAIRHHERNPLTRLMNRLRDLGRDRRQENALEREFIGMQRRRGDETGRRDEDAQG